MDYERLLKTSEDDEDERTLISECPHKSGFRSSGSRVTWSMIAIHGVLISLYTLVFLLVLQFVIHTKLGNSTGHNEVFRAIDGLDIVFKESNTDIYEMTGYHGSPSAEMDHLWEKLLRSRFIAVSGKELDRNDRTSVAIRPGGPYLAWLGIFHELHCLDYVRRVVHREYYYPNITESEHSKLQNHSDHCMDRIQAILMCHPDYSTLTTMKWTDHTKPMVDAVRTMKSCVNWDRLLESLQERVVTENEVQALKKPSAST